MNVEQLSTVELKALAYDQLAQIEAAQRNLKIINDQLVKKQDEQQVIQDQPE